MGGYVPPMPPVDSEVTQPTRAVIDPSAILTATEFAAALAALTRRQVRGLAEKSNVARSTISGWTTGQHLPNPNQIDQLRRLLTAVGVSEVNQDAWAEAVLRVRQSPVHRGPDRTRTAPYLGLEPFAESDSEKFFGREDVVTAIVDQVQEVRGDPTIEHRVVFLVGASGEGKSSILRAGVAVALVQVPGVTVRVVAPAVDELPALDGLDAAQVVLVDQFEQVLSSGRGDLLEALVTASASEHGPTIVAAVRSDFYPRLVENPAFTSSLVSHQIVLSPMSQEGMRRAIVEPARREGVDIESGLVEMMLSDVAPAASLDDRPSTGVLPLLSHALLETWARGSGRQLRVADYVSLGGLHGAIDKTAEAAFGRLDPVGAEAAGDLFRRLVNIDADGLITRRHAGLDEIAEADGGDGVLTSVMWHFVNARLLTVESTTLTLSHEVLLRAWPRLRAWVADDRDAIRIHRELIAAAVSWDESGDDDGGLLAGGRLDRARGWLASPVGSRLAGAYERRLIEASEERARQRAEHARRRFRRVVALATVSSLLAVVAGIATVDARRSRRAADVARIEAEVRDLSNRSRGASDPYVSAFYALEATQWTDQPLTVARTAWLEATARIGRQSLLRSGFDLDLSAADLAFSPDGTTLAALGRDGAIHLIDPTTRQDIRHSAPVGSGMALAWSPDGQQLVTAGADGTIQLFDAANLTAASRTTDVATTTANDVAWSSDGSTIAVTNNDGLLVLLDATTLAARGAPINTGNGAAQRAAWTPSGDRLATSNFLGDMTVIDAASQQKVTTVRLAGGVVANGLGWNPTGTVIAVTSSDGMVRYFDNATFEQLGPPVSTGASYALSVIWNGDGSEVATVNQDGTLRIFTSVDHRPTGDPALTGTGGASAVAWSPAGDLIVTANDGGNIRFFSVPQPGDPSSVYGARAALSPDGSKLMTTNFDDTLRTFDAATFQPVGDIASTGGDLTAIGWSPDGTRVAVGSASGQVSVRDAALPTSDVTSVAGRAEPVTWIGWSTDASTITVVDHSGHITTRTAATLDVVHQADVGTPLTSAALDPQSSTLAVTGADGNVRLLAADDLHQKGKPISSGSKEANDVAWSSDGKRLSTVNADGTVDLIVAGSHSVTSTYTLSDAATKVAWNPSGDELAVGIATGAVWLLTAPSLEPIGTTVGSDSPSTSLFWMADGTELVSSFANGFTLRSRAWDPVKVCAALRAVLPTGEMDRMIDIPDSRSHCRSDDVRNFTPLPATATAAP